ncbi:MAG: PIN domain-containing protein [Propylenella sp.]
MLAVDTSTWIAFVQGDKGRDVERLDSALASGDIAFPPVVVTEILSERSLPADQREIVLAIPSLEITEGYWLRAGAMRATILARRLRARLADMLIAQSCIDHDVALITRDGDFRHFAEHCGLRLA